MSVTEIAPRNDDFERTPPHDVAAEQCVLGGMLLSKDAISDVIEVIRPADHYRVFPPNRDHLASRVNSKDGELKSQQQIGKDSGNGRPLGPYSALIFRTATTARRSRPF